MGGGMVDVSGKEPSLREAEAEARLKTLPGTARRLFAGELPKGDAIECARAAGTLAAKRTPELIPLCHPIPVEHVEVSFEPLPDGALIRARVRGRARTGVEMEALTAVSVAALTLYDHVKAVERGASIERVELVEKTGGKEDYHRAEVVSINASAKKGTGKEPTGRGLLVPDHGLEGDVHAAPGERQVSLLAEESIEKQKGIFRDRAEGCPRLGEEIDAIGPGSFAENITTRGVVLHELPLGTRFFLPSGAALELSRIGKECHTHCAIHKRLGDCIMPREGVFARVLEGGEISPGDRLRLVRPTEREEGLRAAVLTVSDRSARGEREDRSGPALRKELRALGWELTALEVVPDEKGRIVEALLRLSDSADVVLTTGGTGLSARDVTPEATREVVEKELPGVSEAMRSAGLKHTVRACLSRGVCGSRGECLILNLPGSPRGATESLRAVAGAIPHAVEILKGGTD